MSKALYHFLPILELATAGLRYKMQHALAIHPATESREGQPALLVAEAWRVDQVKQQLDFGLRALYMLPARSAAASVAEAQLIQQDRHVIVDREKVIGHALAPCYWLTPGVSGVVAVKGTVTVKGPDGTGRAGGGSIRSIRNER